MYFLRQFKPSLYLLMLMGFAGFGIAAEEPGLWILASAVLVLQAWLVYRGRFRPMSRWLSNAMCVLAAVYTVVQVTDSNNTPVIVFGEFLIALHLVKLYELRGNRDYGVLLVLSVLLMVAAGITTASFLFGVLFIIYIFLFIYSYLLFHLKAEADRVMAAQPVAPDRFSVSNIRQDQSYFPRSMRKLIFFIATVAACSAVFVFLFFPRGAGSGVLGQMQVRQNQVLTGFNDEAKFNQLARITQNDTPVATVSVWHNDEQIKNGLLRLRGLTFDEYFLGKTGDWQWSRSAEQQDSPRYALYDTSINYPLLDTTAANVKNPRDTWRQQVMLEPIGAKTLFALAGVRELTPHGQFKLAYSPSDETVQREDGVNSQIQYDVISNGTLTPPSVVLDPETSHERSKALAKLLYSLRLPRLSKNIDPAIVQFAHNPAVSGEIVKQRPPDAVMTDLDGQIASNIENYLKTHFSYSLDLTDVADLFEGKDPVAVFVSQVHRGHCELFAGAMTLACQSLGIRARMVFGFVTDEYNSVGDYFQVRQSHAHAWVEVLTPNQGWIVFDPTSGRDMPPNEHRSVLQRVRHVFDWLELKWATSVIAYDGTRRYGLIQALDSQLMRTTYHGAERLNHFQRWWEKLHLLADPEFWSISIIVLVIIISLVLLSLVTSIVWFVIERRRIRRRAAKIGLQSLPIPQQLHMARQLGFFEDMYELLQMHRIARAPHMTAREFSGSLIYLPTEAYKLVDQMTRIFYRVRYGGANVPADQQKRLATAVVRLAEHLGRAGGKTQ